MAGILHKVFLSMQDWSFNLYNPCHNIEWHRCLFEFNSLANSVCYSLSVSTNLNKFEWCFTEFLNNPEYDMNFLTNLMFLNILYNVFR